jgi:hypothetical protein
MGGTSFGLKNKQVRCNMYGMAEAKKDEQTGAPVLLLLLLLGAAGLAAYFLLRKKDKAVLPVRVAPEADPAQAQRVAPTKAVDERYRGLDPNCEYLGPYLPPPYGTHEAMFILKRRIAEIAERGGMELVRRPRKERGHHVYACPRGSTAVEGLDQGSIF